MDHFLGQVRFPNSRSPKSVFPELCGPQRLFQACWGPKGVFLEVLRFFCPSWGPPHDWVKKVVSVNEFVLPESHFGATIILQNLGVRSSQFSSFQVPKGYFKCIGVENTHFSTFAVLKGYFKLLGIHPA